VATACILCHLALGLQEAGWIREHIINKQTYLMLLAGGLKKITSAYYEQELVSTLNSHISSPYNSQINKIVPMLDLRGEMM
jgi:hypothetical protein